MSKEYKLSGFLEKRGVGPLSSRWKKRYFELNEDKLYYYVLNGENKTYKGMIELDSITNFTKKVGNFL